MVLSDALRLAAVGVVTGIGAAVLAGRSVASLLFGTSPADPVVLGAAATIMLLVASAATFFPARAASRANPNELLR
jgi:ABC-type antimicrobial peptide transport system permease subunit